MNNANLKYFFRFILAENKDSISQELVNQVNWTDFFNFSGQYRVLFYSFCNKNFLPKKILSLLEQLSNETELNNKFMLSKALELNQVFIKEQIPVIFYKGVAAISTIYSSHIGSRTLADIDIIVPENYYEHAKKILKSNAYIEDYSNMGLGENEEAKQWFEDNHFHAIFRKGSLIIELHKNLSFDFNKNLLNELFEKSIGTNSQFECIKIPCPEFQILICILNFIHDKIINKGKSWYLEEKSQLIGYSFIALCYEIKLICKYYKANIDPKFMRRLVENSGVEKKASFLLSLVSQVISEPVLLIKKSKFSIFRNLSDPIKCLASSGVLFNDIEVPKTDNRESSIDSFFRFLFLFSKIKPRTSPLGRGIFWLHCIFQLIIFPFNKTLKLLHWPGN